MYDQPKEAKFWNMSEVEHTRNVHMLHCGHEIDLCWILSMYGQNENTILVHFCSTCTPSHGLISLNLLQEQNIGAKCISAQSPANNKVPWLHRNLKKCYYPWTTEQLLISIHGRVL